MRPCFAAALVAFVPVLSSACETGIDPASLAVVSIHLDSYAADLVTGDSRQLTATPLNRAGLKVVGRASWTTSSPAVVTVSPTGLVTAVGAGQAVIFARIDEVEASAAITVVNPALSVEVTPSQTTLDVFDRLQLHVTVHDSDGNLVLGWPTNWVSENVAVVEVSKDGWLTPRSVGSAIVSARSAGQTVRATITVVRLPVTLLYLSESAVTIIQNSQLQINASMRGPGDKVLSGRQVFWSSSNVGVATVSKGGLVTAYGPGDATITATIEERAAQVFLKVASTSLVSLTSGQAHTCGVLATGTAFCWGDNTFGQLGSTSAETCGDPWEDGIWSCRRAPTAVPGGLSFVVLAAGDWHTCGLNQAGQAYCWGNLVSGKFGGSATPVAVPGGFTFATLAAGGGSTCGVTSDGAGYCWGDNSSGQLGDGTINRRAEPVPISGGLRFRQLSVGTGYACGVTTAARLYCWGANTAGQLGNGSFDQSSVPVAVLGDLSVATLQAGASHTCALTTAGQAWCWGSNFNGALGGGSLGSSPIPVAVAGSPRWSSIAAGTEFTCGIDSDGKTFCWGYNYDGQLGVGTNSIRTTPTLVTGGLTFAALTAGRSHTCGRTTSGELYCWGAGWSGQLGTGGTSTVLNPAKVLGQP